MPVINSLADVLLDLRLQASPATDFSTFARDASLVTASVITTTTPSHLRLVGVKKSIPVATGTYSNFGTGDFTIEFDTYTNLGDTNRVIGYVIPTSGLGWSVCIDPANKLTFNVHSDNSSKTLVMTSAAVVTGNTTVTRTLAIVRSGTTMKFFVNGILTDTATIPLYDFIGTPAEIVAGNNSGVSNQGIVAQPGLYGGLARYRITKAALYTATYTRSGETAWGYLPPLTIAVATSLTKRSYIWSGQSVNTTKNVVPIQVSKASYTFTPQNVGFLKSFKIVVTKLSYIFTGRDVVRILPLNVSVTKTTYTFTSLNVFSKQILKRSIDTRSYTYTPFDLFGRVPYARSIPHMNFLWSSSPVTVIAPVRILVDSLPLSFYPSITNIRRSATVVVDTLHTLFTSSIAYLRFGSSIIVDKSDYSYTSGNTTQQRYVVIQPADFLFLEGNALPIFPTNSVRVVDTIAYTYNGRTTNVLVSRGQYYTSGPRIYV